MPGSQDPHSSQALADGYFINHELRYSYLRRDLTLLMAWAACEVKKRFPDQSPLGLGDLSQADGMTPGTDVGHLRHGSTTHRGNDLDVAYYQTDGLNNTQIICGDGTDTNGNSCCGTYNDGKFCTTQQNIVDWPPEAFLFAKMAVSPDTRVFGLDQTLVDAMRLHLDKLVASGDITQAERDHVNLGYGAAGGWQYHHHHSHFSYCRIGGCPRAFIIGGGDFMETMTSPWFDAGQWKGGMAPPPQQPNVLEPLLDGALEVPGVADEKGFYMEPRPSWNASE